MPQLPADHIAIAGAQHVGQRRRMLALSRIRQDTSRFAASTQTGMIVASQCERTMTLATGTRTGYNASICHKHH